MQKIIEKKELNNFVKSLMKNYEVIAPVKRKIARFEILKNPEDMYLDEITLVPLKQFFLPENETLFDFKNNKIKKNKTEGRKRIVFGLRKCDLNALLVLDRVMSYPEYIKKRQNTILVGLYCEKPDEFCFCNSMELEEHYDLFFYASGDKYYISIGSKKGALLVRNLDNADKEVKKEIKNFKKLENKNIEKDYSNKKWDEDVEKCLSCSACTVFCPTCNCFDIQDVKELSENSGKRIKTQSSCQLKSFSEVAGGKIFRESRASRFKHFVYHKIVFYNKRFNKYMCVGCGRCLRACPTRIDWVETINSIKSKKGDKK
ncbi:4Fe-4S dicluster domain-containing protein [Candidatus Pacearchaeota archaeon]|nr:4Fe-4S dicluster domain-containing protein [Candidatus Pacearchaeota archaeon]